MSDIDDIAIIQTAIDRMRSRGTQVSQADLAKLAEYPGLVDRVKAAERQRDEADARIHELEARIDRLLKRVSVAVNALAGSFPATEEP